MKIKIIVNAIPLVNIKTGIGRYIEGLYSELQKFEHIEIFYFDGRNILKNFPKPIEIRKWSKIVDIFWKLPSNLSYFLRLMYHKKKERLFKKYSKKFHIYHETAFFPFECNLPTIFTIHDISLIKYPEYHPEERVKYFNNFFWKRIKNVSYILTVSEFTKKEILSYINFPEEKIVVTYLGYDKNFFKVYPKDEKSETIKKYQIKKPFFLFVGTHDPRKNLKLIERCAERIEHPIYIVGWQGWEKIEGKKNLFPLGYINDIELAHLYNEACALIYPSFYEGFGLPVLEAMACGTPVIVSKKASLPEVAGEAGIYLNDLYCPDELIEKLKKLISDSNFRKEFSNKSINQAKKFSWKNTAKLTYLTMKNTLKNLNDAS